jgi:hypothetical protein
MQYVRLHTLKGVYSMISSARASNDGGIPTCESTHSIDLASLRRRGTLKPGVYSLVWSCRGEPAGSISIVTQADGVRLLYWVTGPKGERMSVDDFVPFRYTRE